MRESNHEVRIVVVAGRADSRPHHSLSAISLMLAERVAWIPLVDQR